MNESDNHMGMTDAEIEALEEQRRQEEVTRLAPYKEASDQRKDSAAIVAEHDEMIVEAMYELAMMKIGGAL